LEVIEQVIELFASSENITGCNASENAFTKFHIKHKNYQKRKWKTWNNQHATKQTKKLQEWQIVTKSNCNISDPLSNIP